jgi:DNA-binding transcriptional LysR family regulator
VAHQSSPPPASSPLPALEALGYFVAVVDAGGFSAAARRLGVRKATLSRQVAQLEHHLGARLLHRTTRVVRLTDDGAAYHQHAVTALAAARDAEAALARRASVVAGRVRVAATPALAELLVAPAIVPLLARYPAIEIEIVVGPRPVDLAAEGFDVAVRGGPPSSPTQRARRVGTSAIGYYASPAYLARRGAPERPAALDQHDLLAVGDRDAPAWWFADGGRLVLRPIRPRLVAAHDLVLRAACAGGGILRLPAYAAAPLVAAGQLVAVLAPFTPPAGPIHVILPDGRPSRAARVVVDQLARSLGSHAALAR